MHHSNQLSFILSLGHSTGLDISSVHNGVNFCSFFVTVMAYGFLGDVLKESERFRWLGPKRYDFAGKICFNGLYFLYWLLSAVALTSKE